MKRLTMEKGLCAKVSTDYCHEHRDCYECSHGRDVFRKLAEYEDIGMTPQEIIVKLATLANELKWARAERDLLQKRMIEGGIACD